MDTKINDWRFHLGKMPRSESPDFGNSNWEQVNVGHKWLPENSTCWYQKHIIVPDFINGIPVGDKTVRMRGGMDPAAVSVSVTSKPIRCD